MKGIKKFTALLLAFSVSAGIAACRKNEVKDSEAWFNATTIDLDLPYNAEDYDTISSHFAGMIKDKAIVTVSYAKPYPKDFDYSKDDPFLYQGDTLEIFDIEGKHLKTCNCRQLGLEAEGGLGMSAQPTVAGDKVIIPWSVYDDKNGNKAIIGFFDPETGKLDYTFEKKTDELVLMDSFICSGGYSAFYFVRNDQNGYMELAIVDGNGNARTIEVSDADIALTSSFPIIDLGDANIVIPYTKAHSTSWSINGYIHVDLKTGTYKISNDDLSWLAGTDTIFSMSYIDGLGLTIADEDGLTLADLDKKDTTRLLDYDKCNANLYLLSRLKLYSTNEGKYVFAGDIVMDNYQRAETPSKIVILEKLSENPNAKKTELKLASFGILDYTTAEAVRLFNEKSNEYYVTFDSRYYTTRFKGNQDEADWQTMNYKAQQELFDNLKVDIIAGEGPDLIMDGSDFTSSFEPVLFADLTEDITRDGVFENVFDANKTGGRLYTIPLSFHLFGIVSDATFIRERQKGFTYEEYEKFIRTICNGKDPIKKNKNDYFLFLYSMMSNEFVFAGSAPDFNNDKIKTMAEYVNRNVLYVDPDEVTDVSKLDDNTHAVSSTFNNTASYFAVCTNKKVDTAIVGYPSDDAKGPCIYVNISIAVSSATKNKAGCLEFIKTLMAEDVQKSYARSGYSIPVNVNAFTGSSREQLEQYNNYRKKLLDMDFTEADLREWGYAAEARNKDITAFENVIRSAETVYRTDPAIALIIKEEFAAYFSGQKTFEQVAEIVSNRAKTYLSERTV